jgi:hypothetical protein
MSSRLIPVVLCLFALPCVAAPVLTFRTDGVDISNLAPGATVVLFAVQQEPDLDHLKTRTFESSLTDDDGDGRVTFEANVKPRSIWVIADITGGEVTTASPVGLGLKPIPGSALRSPQSISLRGDLLEFFYFRPGVGAWRQTVVDSAATDIDGEPDGLGTISFDLLRAVDDSTSQPAHYEHGDILVAINPLDLNGYILGAGN